jgi:hypothetical protein
MATTFRDTANPLYVAFLSSAKEYGEEEFKSTFDTLDTLGKTYDELCTVRTEVESRSGELAGAMRALDLQLIDTPRKDRLPLVIKRGQIVMETQALVTEVYVIQGRHRAARIAYLRVLQNLAYRLNNIWAEAHDVGIRAQADNIRRLAHQDSATQNRTDEYKELQDQVHATAVEKTKLRTLVNEARTAAQYADTVIRDLERVRDSELRVARGALTPAFRSQ